MRTLRETEPFAYGYMNAGRDDIEYRIASGLLEYAKHVPLAGFDKAFVTIPDRRNPLFGVNYYAGAGIAVAPDKIDGEIKAFPELSEQLSDVKSTMLPLDTKAKVLGAFSDLELKLCGIRYIDGREIRVCWGGKWIGHSNPDYRMLLRLGTSGLRRRVEVGRQMNTGKDDFYDSLVLTLDALDTLGRRARDLAMKAGNEKLARAFESIPENKPRDFFEACQLFWLAFIFDGIDSPGRFDYFMNDFVGLCTDDERRECMRALWELFYETRTWNLCIGGSDENGKYFSNALTYEILELAREYRYNTPNLTMRMSAETPDALWQSAAKTIATGIGMPALYNDEVVCPALETLGITPEDAHNYCMNGCNQIDIFGKSHMGLEDGEVCLAKCIDLTLHGGECGLTGAVLGIDTGSIEKLDSYEKFFAAYRRQAEHMTDCAVKMANLSQKIYAEFAPNPLRSILIQGCVEKGRDYKNGGPIYNHGQILAEGIADTANSLYALKKFVYDEKKYMLSDVVNALDNDFDGYDEMLRDFTECPKFGNDCDEVDTICASVVEHFYSYLRTKRTFRGGIYGGGCSTFNRAADYGKGIGALPSGKRKYSDIFADSIGAVPGTDKNGPTALLNSVCREPQYLAVSGNVLNIKFTKQLFACETGEKAFVNLAKTYFAKGGQQLSVSVVSAAELRDAKEHPELHENLIVRVGGFSEYFCRLTPELQNNIISRTENGL